MCIACSPGFQAAFRSLSWPSRRKFLKSAAAVAASAAHEIRRGAGLPSAREAIGALFSSLAHDATGNFT